MLMYSITELKNILRIYHYSFASLAADIGITKSYLSKIINRKAASQKHEKNIDARIQEMLKTKQNINIKKKPLKYFKFINMNVKDIPLRNGIQAVLDGKKITVTQLSRDIDEARSSVSQVIMGLRHTKRIEEKIINYLKLDKDIFFSRTAADIFNLEKGIIVPLPTKAKAKQIKKDRDVAFKKLKQLKL